MNKLATALVKAKSKFLPALKTSMNPHLRNKYAGLPACIDAVDGAFIECGIFMYQETFECNDGVIVETVLLHESGELLRCGRLHVPAPKQDPQGYGSALSYARRYSLMTACGIAPEDDDGEAATRSIRAAVQKPTQAPQTVDTDTGEVLNRKSPREQLEEAQTLEQLQALFKKFWQGSDGKTQKQLKQTYDACKAKFVEVAA